MNSLSINNIWLLKALGLRFSFIVLFLFQVSATCFGQTSPETDSAELAKRLQNKQLKYHYLVDFYSSFSLNQIINGVNGNDKNSVYFYYNATLAGDLYYKKFSFNSFYATELGVTTYFDSIVVIQVDQYNFKNSISYRLANSKFAMNFMLTSRSQYFKHYYYSIDSTGSSVATPNSSYKSPGYQMISGGIKYSTKGLSIEFGIVNGMSTIMKNQKYYDILKTSNLYGLEKGQRKKMDFGFSLIISAPIQKIHKNLYYENFSQARVIKDDLSLINRYSFDINQAFHYVFLKYFRISLRSKIIYDYRISLKPSIINNVTLGLYFHNSL